MNAKYQQQVEDALKKQYAAAKAAGATQYSNGAYAVAMNPKTGALLAIAGIDHNAKTNKDTDDALGVINKSFVMGSAVKGATVAGGLMKDRKSTRLNSSHVSISYAVVCLKKKKW